MGLAISWCLKLGWKPASVPVPQPGQVVILDNATFHKGGGIQQLPLASGRSNPLFAALFARPEQNRKLLVLAQKPHSQAPGLV